MKQLLVEYFPLVYDIGLVNESVKNNGTVKVKALLQRANAKNQNGRVYPKQILMRESQAYLNEFITQRRAVGELDHPESTVVNLKNVSHNLTELHWEGDDLYGTLEILSTPSGNIVKELMRNGIRIGVSSRGIGSVKPMTEDTVEVDEDFKILCWDIVSNPSTHGAFLKEGIEQSLQFNKINRINFLVSEFLEQIQ